jgi:hypothetical protein
VYVHAHSLPAVRITMGYVAPNQCCCGGVGCIHSLTMPQAHDISYSLTLRHTHTSTPKHHTNPTPVLISSCLPFGCHCTQLFPTFNTITLWDWPPLHAAIILSFFAPRFPSNCCAAGSIIWLHMNPVLSRVQGHLVVECIPCVAISAAPCRPSFTRQMVGWFIT